MTSRERLTIYDTTLRDGAQTHGLDFSLEEKIAVIGLLERLGVDVIEGGYPGANPIDTELFAKRRTRSARFAAFGMTKRAGRSAGNDPGVAALLNSAADTICYVAKSWDYHVDLALGITLAENLESVEGSVAAAVAAGKQAMLDCEHFFDGYKANPAHALDVARTAIDAGARWVILCDTNGGTMPEEVFEIVTEIARHVPGASLGIHAHDDTGQALANSLAAVRAGVRQIQGTLNGIGERCGNTDLVALIPTLKLKAPYADRFEIGVTDAALADITHISRSFDELLNRAPDRQAPYVGASAFATKAGIHASAILKAPDTYEHIPPEAVGNRRVVSVSDQAGKSNLLAALQRIGIAVEKGDPKLDRLLFEVKEREAAGYAYETADASFALLARRVLGKVPSFFDVDSFRVVVERRHNAIGELITVTEAVVKVTIGGERILSVAEGNGPVNALDLALRKDLGPYAEAIADLELVDFKVRILNGGTSATTRVLIESGDATGERWFTIGVSPNIVDASFEALIDSIVFKLLKSEAAAAPDDAKPVRHAAE